jgi:hypothetical protein
LQQQNCVKNYSNLLVFLVESFWLNLNKIRFYLLRYSEFLIKVKKETLYYLAPEIMRALGGQPDIELPYSEASDIYAFG